MAFAAKEISINKDNLEKFESGLIEDIFTFPS